MLLQPFAENAVIHGLQHKEGERMLKIEVKKESNQYSVNSEQFLVNGKQLPVNSEKREKEGIVICIEDNGIGRAAAQNLGTNKNGKGSKLMQERLKILQEKQGEKYRLQITDLTENGATGTRVEIWIPEEK
jgi:sensor histidine kinase YesM